MKNIEHLKKTIRNPMDGNGIIVAIKFRLNFLGHIVHDLEARIVDTREKERYYE